MPDHHRREPMPNPRASQRQGARQCRRSRLRLRAPSVACGIPTTDGPGRGLRLLALRRRHRPQALDAWTLRRRPSPLSRARVPTVRLRHERARRVPPRISRKVIPGEAARLLRGETSTAREAAQTHCKRGHLLAGANLYRRPDGSSKRECRNCRNSARRRSKAQAA